MPADLLDRTAVITGGTAGVGLETALRLARRGATVVVTGRTAERGAQALATLREVSEKVFFEQGDAGDAESVTELFERATTDYGGINILVVSGVHGEPGATPFADLTLDDIRRSFDTRLYPRVYPVRAALPALRERGGSIVMLTTDAARHPTPGESTLGAVGAAMILLVKAWAREFARWDIAVNGVAMTITSGTPSWDRIFAGESFQSHLFSKALARFPKGAPPSAGDVAAVVEFLAADADQVTGQTVSVNGGLSFGGW